MTKGEDFGNKIFTFSLFLWLFDLPDPINTFINIFRQFSLLYCVSGIVTAVLYASDVFPETKDDEK